MDGGSDNVIQMKPKPPCTDVTDALPLIPMIGHNENLYETQLMSGNLKDLSTVNLNVIENTPVTKDSYVEKLSPEFNALPAHSSFQENPDSLIHVFTGNSARNVITSDRMLTRGLSDPPKMFPQQNENSIYGPCNTEQLPQLRNKEQDDQDHEVVIPVNILKLLQDEDENATVAATDNKRGDILDFLTSESHVVGTEFPHTPQISQVNIL